MFQPFDSHTHYGVSLMLHQATETRIVVGVAEQTS